jgi:hypothetical protein
MKSKAYWIVTGLVALAMTGSGVVDLMASESVLAVLRHLGYPDYLAKMLGAAKIAGVLALLAPVPRWVREWAYAGFVFDLGGAVISHVIVGDAIAPTASPAALLALVVASYVLWRRRLAAMDPSAAA